MHEADAESQPDQLCLVAQLQLSVNAVQMGVNRLSRQAELPRDLIRALALRGEAKDLALPLGQHGEPCRQGLLVLPCSGKALRQTSRKVQLATRDDIECANQRFGFVCFEHVSGGSGVHCVQDVLGLAVSAQNQDTRSRNAAKNLSRRNDPIHSSHDEVHDDDVRFRHLDQPKRLTRRGGFADHFESQRSGQEVTESYSNDFVVIDEDDRCCPCSSCTVLRAQFFRPPSRAASRERGHTSDLTRDSPDSRSPDVQSGTVRIHRSTSHVASSATRALRRRGSPLSRRRARSAGPSRGTGDGGRGGGRARTDGAGAGRRRRARPRPPPGRGCRTAPGPGCSRRRCRRSRRRSRWRDRR
jgi:hypothetical protein